MSGQRVAYIRVSSRDQNVGRQLDGVAVDRTFTDTASGTDVTRPQLAAMLGFVREDDTVIVHSMEPPGPQPRGPPADRAGAWGRSVGSVSSGFVHLPPGSYRARLVHFHIADRAPGFKIEAH